MDDGVGGRVAGDRVDPRALRHIHVPHIDRSPAEGAGGGGGPPPPSVSMPDDTQDLGPVVTVGDFRALDPQTLLRLLSQAHVDYFVSDIRFAAGAKAGEFVQLRYQLGERGEPWELHSGSFPLDVDSWTDMREQLEEHIKETRGGLPLEQLGSIAVRMVYFHDARAHVSPEGPEAAHGALAHPLDFACWLKMTVQEFADFVVDGTLPRVVRVGLDASYHWLGPDTPRPFGYTKHWRFFAEVLMALSRTVRRPLDRRDPLVELLLSQTHDDVADMVLGLGLKDRRSYESAARVYRPRVEVSFAADELCARFEDPQGLMRLYAMDLPGGDYQRRIEGNRVELRRTYLVAP